VHCTGVVLVGTLSLKFKLFFLNPLLALTYQNVLDLIVDCQAKRTQTYWYVHKFKCPLKKTQTSCPGSRDLNWTGKGLMTSLKQKQFINYYTVINILCESFFTFSFSLIFLGYTQNWKHWHIYKWHQHTDEQASVFVDGKRRRELLEYLMLLVSDVRLGYKKRLLNMDATQPLSDINAL
jgi:hypothetical protein